MQEYSFSWSILLVGIAVCLLISGLILMISVRIVRRLFRLKPQTTGPTGPQRGQDWPEKTQTQVDSASTVAPNPYSAPAVVPNDAPIAASSLDVLPVLGLGKAVLISVSWAILSFAFRMLQGVISIFVLHVQQGDLTQTIFLWIFYAFSLFLLVGLVKWTLPTRWSWALFVSIAYFLICIVGAVLFTLLVVLPRSLFA